MSNKPTELLVMNYHISIPRLCIIHISIPILGIINVTPFTIECQSWYPQYQYPIPIPLWLWTRTASSMIWEAGPKAQKRPMKISKMEGILEISYHFWVIFTGVNYHCALIDTLGVNLCAIFAHTTIQSWVNECMYSIAMINKISSCIWPKPSTPSRS